MESTHAEELWLARYVCGLFIIAVACICFWMPYTVRAHDTVTIATSTSAAIQPPSMYRTVVFINDSIGYIFYVRSTGACVYQKTTDGGLTWGFPVTADSANGTDCLEVTVWYDRWTPGDTTGNYIHIGTFESGTDDTFYTRLDTTDDSLTTSTSSATGVQVPGNTFTTGGDDTMFTKGTDGVLYTGINDVSGNSWVAKCSTTCTTATNWATTTDLTPFDAANDFTVLLPLAGGSIIAIQDDINTDDYRSRVYNGSTWDAQWTIIDPNATENSSFDGPFSAAVDPSTNDIYLAYGAELSSIIDANNDIRVGKYSGGSWATTTTVSDVYTNGRGATMLSLGLSGQAIYVAFATTTGTATSTVYWKYSTTSMLTWSATSTAATTSVATTSYGLSLPMYSDERMYAIWLQDSIDDYVGLTIADIFPSSSTAYIKITGEAWFTGTLAITGALAKGWGTFLIDHPLQPFSRLLAHSFLESPDAKNIYDGIAQLSPYGDAIVQLPDYFEALNTDFRYQYFPLDEAMPGLYIKEKIANNRFVIAGGTPGGRVSWQVTGVRHDPYIKANPIVVEVEKGIDALVQKGKCLFEPLCH